MAMKIKLASSVFWLFLATVMVVGFSYWSARSKGSLGEVTSITNTVVPKMTVTSKPVAGSVGARQGEYLASFSDLFSGVAWLDKQQTTLHQDLSATSLSLKPDVKVQLIGACSDLVKDCQKISQSIISSPQCQGSNCLTTKDNQLFYNQHPVILPGGASQPITNLAIKAWSGQWLVAGVRVLANQRYQPVIWHFDGHDFQELKLASQNNQTLETSYLGHFGFGSNQDSLLILYSAYEGMAWQIKGAEIRDLSQLFGIRVNNGGFVPQIIASGQGGQIKWYVFDQSGQQARWLKFWQNGTDWIEGVADITASLPVGSRAAYADINQSTQLKIVADNGQEQLYKIDDRGFLALADNQATSVSLTAYDKNKPRIVGAVIDSVVGGWSGFGGQWFFSTDGQKWQEVQIGQRLDFVSPVDNLWWRWRVKAGSDRQMSPYLKMITINYFRLADAN